MKITKETWNNIGMKKSKEIESNKSEEQKELETLNFFRMAFCVDESVELLNVKLNKGFKIEGVVKLVDSKRGMFYIGILKQKIKGVGK